MNATSRPQTPEEPPQDLWSSILDSVSSSRSIPAKQVLLLGEPGTGKSTLGAALLQKAPAAEETRAETTRLDFALGYDWADVRDDADEDTLARLSVYEIPSSDPSYTSLLPTFVPPKTALPHTVAMIVLDWTRPWTFIEELETWMQWIDKWTEGDGSRETIIAREENRERLQSHLQRYVEPSAEPTPVATTLPDALLPLGPGLLTNNTSGVPIIVVCTKADHIDDNADVAGGGMVKGKSDEWEERTDGIMQILRTICMKYGAALFYTTQSAPTLATLRQYALHLLFMPPAPTPGGGAPGEVVAPARNLFPFTARSNTLDRDHIVVPAGWDSWGKIGILREGFDAKGWGAAWERDLATEPGENMDEPGAMHMFSELVQDESPKAAELPPFNEPLSEQVFLARHYDENAKKADRDPRGAFRNPGESAAGVVGPLGSSSFSLPTVERALNEMEGASIAAAPAAATSLLDKDRKRTATGGRPALASSQSSRPGSTAPAATSPGNGQTQHEVLHNFFQSLLTSKDRAGASAAVSKATNTKSPTKPATADSPEAE